jgi:hypothetical protein
MSASVPTPPPRRARGVASGPRGARSRPALVAALLGLVVTIVGGCTKDADGAAATPAPSPSLSTSPTATPTDEQAELLAQYRKFWTTLTPASRLPAAERRAVLAEVAVDPALKSLLNGMSQADLKGEVFYGADVPRPNVRINPDATTALVDDCQDSSHAGIAVKATGKRVTVGVDRNHVSVTMKKQPGGLWKVAYVDYTKSSC